jgi:hypothetical protein
LSPKSAQPGPILLFTDPANYLLEKPRVARSFGFHGGIEAVKNISFAKVIPYSLLTESGILGVVKSSLNKKEVYLGQMMQTGFNPSQSPG